MTSSEEGPTEADATQTPAQTAPDAPRGDARPAPDPGWYPDPDQPQTVRYWDGNDWTDQRAPDTDSTKTVAKEGSIPGSLMTLLVMSGIGALAALIGMFLPAAEGPMGIPIQDNSMAQSGSWAVFVPLLFAILATVDIVFTQRPSTGRLIWLFLTGAWVLGMAIRFGNNLPFEPLNRFSAQVIEQNPLSVGIGVYAVGAGGVLISIAAILTYFNRDDYLVEKAKSQTT